MKALTIIRKDDCIPKPPALVHKFSTLKATLITLLFFAVTLLNSSSSYSQTPTDGLMMRKGLLCNILSYGNEKFNHYWEGTLKRTNLNMGTITSQNVMYMGALGITNSLNLMVGLPYIWTKASSGTLQGRKGIQDLSLDLKLRALKIDAPYGKISLFGVLGFSTPLSNYAPDFLPLSIGLHSTNGIARGIFHYQTNKGFFATFQASYIRKSNIKIDRESYYTDKQYNTNEVVVPDVFHLAPRIGYASYRLIAEAYLDKYRSMSGTDIRRNDMPFPANKMDATKIGAMALYRFKDLNGIGVVANVAYTLEGRNVGQATSISAGITYVFFAWKSKQKSEQTSTDASNSSILN